MLRRVLANAEAREDLILALVILAFSILIHVMALSLPPPLFDPLGSAAIPKLVSAILVLISLIIGLGPFLRKPEAAGKETLSAPASPEDVPPPLRPEIAAASIVIVVAYVASMSIGVLGFREATILFVIALGGVMSRFRGRTMIYLTIIALIIGFGFAWLFSEILYIDLPQSSVFGAL
jgi:putative tricarboxylic transport membrane protein